jgi:hypothetical protein
MHSSFAWGFWWLNVVVCTYCILYWAPKRFPNGTHALVMPSGQIWVWQLIFSVVVLALDASPWHLIWLAFVSIIVSMVTGRVFDKMRLNRRIKEQETNGPERYEAIHQEFQKRGKTKASSEAAELLESEMNQNALYEFLGQYPSLSIKFFRSWLFLTRSNIHPSRWDVSLMFNQISIKLAEERDFYAASTCLICSSLFVKDSPLRWAAGAEVYCAWQDRIAGKWAARVIGFRITDKTSTDVRQQFSGKQGQRLLGAEFKRMQEIIDICEEHEEWRDSYPLIKDGEEAYFIPNF